jgi:hypothetical protein
VRGAARGSSNGALRPKDGTHPLPVAPEGPRKEIAGAFAHRGAYTAKSVWAILTFVVAFVVLMFAARSLGWIGPTSWVPFSSLALVSSVAVRHLWRTP